MAHTMIEHPVHSRYEAVELCRALEAALSFPWRSMASTLEPAGYKVLVSQHHRRVYLVSGRWSGQGHDVIPTSSFMEV